LSGGTLRRARGREVRDRFGAKRLCTKNGGADGTRGIEGTAGIKRARMSGTGVAGTADSPKRAV
jgi:hypothetical protein